jgi:hypothetical protein
MTDHSQPPLSTDADTAPRANADTAPHADAEAALRAIARLNRRHFLRFSVLACAAAAIGGTPVLGRVARAAPPAGIAHIDEAQAAVFERLIAVALPTQGTRLLPTDKVPVMATLDAALLATMEPHILTGLKEGIAYFEQGPVAQYGKPFTRLDDAEAAAFCEAWANSSQQPQRALAMGLKKLVGLAYWANPPTWDPLGYDGPVSVRWGLTPRGNQPLPHA